MFQVFEFLPSISKVSNSFRWSLYKPKNAKVKNSKSFPLQSGAVLEVRNQKAEIRNQKSEIRKQRVQQIVNDKVMSP